MKKTILKLHLDIFDSSRLKIWQQLKALKAVGILGGGTALALQIGHRRSYDFDIFTVNPIEKSLLASLGEIFGAQNIEPVIDQKAELTIRLFQQVQITFLHHPFPPMHPLLTSDSLNLFSLYDLASSKACTIGRRGTWRDYVDIYWLLVKQQLSLKQVIQETKQRFPGQFSEKLFYEQLVYWNDIHDYAVEYLHEGIDPETIKTYFRQLVKDMVS